MRGDYYNESWLEKNCITLYVATIIATFILGAIYLPRTHPGNLNKNNHANAMSREKDIQELCKQVKEMIVEVYYNPNGADRSTCPLCDVSVGWEEFDISILPHGPNCGYLIAKDLSTNVKNTKDE